MAALRQPLKLLQLTEIVDEQHVDENFAEYPDDEVPLARLRLRWTHLMFSSRMDIEVGWKVLKVNEQPVADGDDFARNLAAGILHAPVFPTPAPAGNTRPSRRSRS